MALRCRFWRRMKPRRAPSRTAVRNSVYRPANRSPHQRFIYYTSDMPLLTFEHTMASIDGQAAKRHLLLGNGFSIALKPDIFSYGSLYENADFSTAPHIPQLFKALGT